MVKNSFMDNPKSQRIRSMLVWGWWREQRAKLWTPAQEMAVSRVIPLPA